MSDNLTFAVGDDVVCTQAHPREPQSVHCPGWFNTAATGLSTMDEIVGVPGKVIAIIPTAFGQDGKTVAAAHLRVEFTLKDGRLVSWLMAPHWLVKLGVRFDKELPSHAGINNTLDRYDAPAFIPKDLELPGQFDDSLRHDAPTRRAPANNGHDQMLGLAVPKEEGKPWHDDPEVMAGLRKSDPVNRPTHYNDHPAGIECIEVTRHMTFNVGNAVKYAWRHGLKGGENNAVQDLNKAIWYLMDEVERIGGTVTARPLHKQGQY